MQPGLYMTGWPPTVSPDDLSPATAASPRLQRNHSRGHLGWQTAICGAFLLGQQFHFPQFALLVSQRHLGIRQLILEFADRAHQIVAPATCRLGGERIIEMSGI